MATTRTALETLLKGENAVVLVALLALTLLAWIALLAGAGTGMDPAAMSGWWLPLTLPAGESWSWTPSYWLIAFLMWTVMMVAMMLPSAAPLLLLYAMVLRRAESQGRSSKRPAAITAFTSCYLALWALFSALAVVIQFGLEKSGLMSAMMATFCPASTLSLSLTRCSTRPPAVARIGNALLPTKTVTSLPVRPIGPATMP